MFTLEEIEAMAARVSCGYSDKNSESATFKLMALKKMMQDTGIKEVKIIL